MQSFVLHKAIAAPLRMDNVDTDMIIPKQFLTTIERAGLGKHAFDDMRYLADGSDNPDFVLNQSPYNQAGILIAGDNFGCGSSREHAPWALQDFGIRCVIAPDFADIFYNNCFKNGMLPIRLPKEQVEELMTRAETHLDQEMVIDLESQIISAGNHKISFEVEPFRKHCLLNGLDDIGLTLEKTVAITTYEEKSAREKPWL